MQRKQGEGKRKALLAPKLCRKLQRISHSQHQSEKKLQVSITPRYFPSSSPLACYIILG